MSLALNVTNHWTDGKRIHVAGTLTPSGNYVALGDTLSFGIPAVKSKSVPFVVIVYGSTGLNVYRYQPGSNITNGKLTVMTAGVEIPAAAYPVGVTGDVISVYAIFHKFI